MIGSKPKRPTAPVICEACGDEDCTRRECGEEIRAEMRADADRDDPWAADERAERRLQRLREDG